MSAHYALEVLRAEDIARYSEPKLSSKAKNFYIKVSCGDDTKKTQIQDGTRPEWNELLTISSEATSCNLTVELKQRSTFRRTACIGSAIISLEELLSRSAHGEVRLGLLDPSNSRPSTPAGVVLLRLKSLTETERAGIDINTAIKRVDQSGIANPDRTERFDTVDGTVTSLSSQSDLAKSLGSILAKMDVFVGIIDKLATVHPYLSAAWQVTSSLYKVVRNQVETDRKFLDMVHMIEDVFNLISDVEFIRDKVKRLEKSICLFMQQSTECCTFIHQYYSRGFVRRTLDITSKKKIDDFTVQLSEMKQALMDGVDLQTTFVSARMSEKIDTIFLRQELNPPQMDASTRKQCLPGTRAQILDDIMDWLFSETDETILCLRGVAGSGKSTIAMTIAEYCQEMCRLGAYLFFEREKSDPSSVIRGIAYSLASFDKSIATHIAEAVKKHSGIGRSSIVLQFTKLINEPLQVVAGTIQGPVVIILDALDECGSPEARATLMSLFEREFPKLPRAFRFLVTCRPEMDIYRALSSASASVHGIDLDYASQSSRDDVHQYIDYEMQSTFEKKSVELPSKWDQNITLLSNTANGLFVWASTVVKMVSASDDPFEDFEDLLSYCSSIDPASRQNKELGLNNLYETVLLHSGIRWTNDRSRSRFVQVLSVILLSKIPLSVAAIDDILGFPERSSSRLIIECLQSVLVCTPGSYTAPVRLYHASFSDYLTAPECASKPWFLDVAAERLQIAMRCFDVMAKDLRFNICGIESSFVYNDTVPGIEECIKKKIPSSLEYACRFWAAHLSDVSHSSALPKLLDKLATFAEQSLLYWLEVLSLTKWFKHVAGRALLDATLWSATDHISTFLWAAYRLAVIFFPPISQSVAHIYLSALSLAKGESEVANHYSKMHPVIQVRKFGKKPFQPCMRTFRGHTKGVSSAAFSPDGRRIASSSADKTIRVWDAEGGDIVFSGPLTGHADQVFSVSFSHNGKCLVSASADKTIRIWDSETGEVISRPFEGHTGSVHSAAFSPDDRYVVSGSYDSTVRVWDVASGKMVLGPLEEHTGRIFSVVFSPNGKRIASASADGRILVWDARSGKVVMRLEHARARWVSSVFFSPDGTRIASASGDGTICIWDSESGEAIAGLFEGHTNSVRSISFSLDGRQIVSGSADKTICIWDITSGKVISGPFAGHEGPVHSVCFSPEGKRIVSASRDGTVRVWDAGSVAVASAPCKAHTDAVSAVAFSSNCKYIVSGSHDATIRVWDTQRNELVAGPFEGHTGPVSAVAFSFDAKRIVSGSQDKTVRIWDAESGDPLSGLLEGHGDTISSVAFSSDGKHVASGSDDAIVYVWDAETGDGLGPLEGHNAAIYSVVFSDDCKHVVSTAADGTTHIWDVKSGDPIPDLPESCMDLICPIASDGDSITSGSAVQKNPVSRGEIGSTITRFGPSSSNADVARQVISTVNGMSADLHSGHKTTRSWMFTSGLYSRNSRSMPSLAFSSDGRYFVLGSNDKTIRVWDVMYGKAQMSLLESNTMSDANALCVVGANINTQGEAGRDETDVRDLPSQLEVTSLWKTDDDGWLLGRNGELLLWIPLDVRQTLWQPCNTAVLSCEFSTKLDLTGCKIGRGWYEGYKGTAEK